MAPINLESLLPDWKIVVEEAIKGQEAAIRLEILLKDALPSILRGSDSAVGVLIGEVLSSFSGVLSAVKSGKKPEIHQGPATADVVSTPSDDHTMDVNSRGRQWKFNPAARRGAYRRRAHPYSWRKITSKTIYDGHSWRKYGQKMIHCSKFPRGYYRCSHKHDQGCQAGRQVQQSDDDPTTFVITYIGDHTCVGDTTKPTGSARQETPYLINFGSNGKPEPEQDEEVMSGVTSNSGFAVPGLSGLGGPEYVGPSADQADVTSVRHCPNTTLGVDLDLDLMADSFEFDGVLSYDHDDFFKDWFL